MHAIELVEVAALVALQGPLLVDGGPEIHSSHLEQYWISAKCRSEHWHRTLKQARENVDSAPATADRLVVLRATLDEIFLSEMLTRD
jgi:hypothetical protein